jgi:hypothetical protein
VCLLTTTFKGDEIMKSIRRFTLLKVLLLAIAVISTSAIPAKAQTTTGTFSLAHKVLWANAVLPPGDYAFSLSSQDLPARVVVRRADGPVVAMLLPQSVSDDDFVGSSSLVLHQESGESVVSVLRLKNTGMALQFASPKLPKSVSETAGLGPLAASRPTK